MVEQNTLREAENVVTIEGTLLEIRHSEWKSGKGLNIELDIEVAENEVHTVHGMSGYKKKDGTDNGVAKGYQTIIDEYLSVAAHGRENADKVRVTQGRIGLNEFYGQDDKLHSNPRITTNFVNRVQTGEDFNPRAEFETELVVKSVRPETDKDGEETGRTILEGYIPVYGGKVIPFTFKTDNNTSEYVLNNFEPGQTVYVSGDIINYKEKIIRKSENGFGKPREHVTYKTIREYVITGGEEPYDEENVKSYDPELIKKALVERETYLAELKTNNTNNKSKPNDEKKQGGFGKIKTKEKTKFDTSDLPF